MDDLKILHDACDAPVAPSHEAYARARAALLERAAGRRRRERLRSLRLAGAGTGALALAIAVIVAANLGGTGSDGRPRSVVPGLPGVPVAAAEVLERAADAAERKPFTPPRDDQWLYFEDRFSGSKGEPRTWRTWRRADGGAMAWIENGKLKVETLDPPREPAGRPIPIGPLAGYKAVAALPTDPDALLRWAYEQAENITGGGLNDHGDVFLLFEHMMSSNVLPPELEAGIFRALKQVPGVTLDPVDVFGRPAFALGLTEDWLHQELLLDRETYTYVGQRSTIVKDARIDPRKAGNETGEVKKGGRVVAERVTTAIVDDPGGRP
jgi:hypothetical protein